TRMSTYLSAFEANQIVDEYFYDDALFLVDDQIMQLYLKLMYVTAFKIYGWDENLMYETYLNIDDYALEQFEVTTLLPSESNQFNFQMEPYMVILIIIGLLVVFGGGGRYLIYPLLSMIGVKSNKGGGGKSGGYWFKK